ncbi:hypothetical protein LINPERHAP2_LOCUS35790 [Linum perenne]
MPLLMGSFNLQVLISGFFFFTRKRFINCFWVLLSVDQNRQSAQGLRFGYRHRKRSYLGSM